MEDHNQQGAFSWNELLTKDVEGTKNFYSELLGWNTEDVPMEVGSYTILKVGEVQVGGIMTLPPQAEEMGALSYWGAYITVDDVDATAAKATEMGATLLVPPQDIPGVGRFSTIQDPQGAVISVIKYAPMEE